MTPDAQPLPKTCSRCGAGFGCGAATSGCWCAAEAFRLPLPADGEDCLCRACLRAAAAVPDPA